jgi:hypothetical protein
MVEILTFFEGISSIVCGIYSVVMLIEYFKEKAVQIKQRKKGRTKRALSTDKIHK